MPVKEQYNIKKEKKPVVVAQKPKDEEDEIPEFTEE